MTTCACLYAECRKVGYCLAKKKAVDSLANNPYHVYEAVEVEHENDVPDSEPKE